MSQREFDESNPYAAPESDLAPEAFVERTNQVQYASFWGRFVAAFVDGILLRILHVVAGIALGLAISGSGLNQFQINILAWIVEVVIGWLYFALQESSEARATIGKRMMGIKVVDLSLQQISFGQATGRHFGKFISAVILLIGFLMQPFTEKKQALHDIMSGCLVIKA